jgi:RNA polymerase sigma-70 factor (ECF subfamily)
MPCPQRGRKRESSGVTGRKQGSRIRGGAFPKISFTKSLGINAAGASRADQCYEPAGTQFVIAIPERDHSGGIDHDFVIYACGCNKLKDRPNCNVGARVREREDEWTGLMRLAISGDSAAYHRLLKAVAPVLRAAARRGLARAGQPVDQSEDIVQDILLAVHLKRHTWNTDAPFAPWLFAIARNKLIDSLRRRGRRVFVNIDDFADTIPSEPVAQIAPATEVAAQLQLLPARQRDVVQSIAVESASIKDTAAKFAMSEGAVRVALHRGLASLTAKLREQ